MFTTQPGKAIWATFAVLYTICKTPFLALIYTIPSMRPCAQWTFRQALATNILQAFLYHSAVVESVTPLRLDPDSEGDRFVQMSPADEKLYQGVLNDPEIKPGLTGGTWYPAKPSAIGSSNVVLHFHGGAYAVGEGRPGDSAYLASVLTRHIAPHAMCLTYRLASNQNGRFPAALQDAVTGYAYLLSQGWKSSQIIISGDSAGGHLAISFLRYLASSNLSGLPHPKAAVLWSPWVDLVSGRQVDHTAKNKNYKTDFLADNFIVWGAKKLCGDLDVSDERVAPYLQPVDHGFSCPIPIWMCIGGVEVFREASLRFARAMQDQDKDQIVFYVVPNAPHDVVFVGNILGWEAQVDSAAEAARSWLDKH